MDFFSILNSHLPFAAQLSVVAILGLILGSFASLVSHRLVTKESIIFARSKCINCNFQLKFRNLVPLFSWIIQRSKCTSCNKNISARYPLIELGFAVSFLIIFLGCGSQFSAQVLLFFLITTTLFVISIIDLEHYFIPDFAQYFLAILVIILKISEDGVFGATNNIKAALLYAGFGLLMLWFFYITTKTQAIGIDDIKFFFIAGLLLGINHFLLFMIISGILGTVFGAIWQRIKNDKTFPFAPPICAALLICMLFGDKINPIDLFGTMIF